MATYIALSNFTDQGIRTVKDTTKRAAAIKEMAKAFGIDVAQVYWTLGQYDMVAVIEANDEHAATAFALAIGSAGNIRSQTLRAFNGSEMTSILSKMP